MINFEKIIFIASKTPSGDNLQPWFFKVEEKENRLKIFHDHDLAVHSFNPKDIASALSFGMMLFYIEEEALRQNYEMSYTVNESAILDVNRPFIECTFQENTSGKKAYFTEEVVLKRSIGRGDFLKKDIPSEEFEKFLIQMNVENDLMNFTMNQEISKPLLKSMKNMERAFWNKKHCLQDIFKWVHFTNFYHQKIKRGFYWKELCLELPELLFIYTIKNATAFAIFLFNAFAHIIVFSKFMRTLKNAGFVMLSLKKEPSISEWLLVGRNVMRYWLKVTELGMVVQPISIQSFFVSFHRWGIDHNGWSEKTIDDLEKSLTNNFKVKEGYRPFWLYRMGFAQEKDMKWRSIRLPTEVMRKA